MPEKYRLVLFLNKNLYFLILYCRTHGFKRIKMLNKGSAPCCFVEYQVSTSIHPTCDG